MFRGSVYISRDSYLLTRSDSIYTVLDSWLVTFAILEDFLTSASLNSTIWDCSLRKISVYSGNYLQVLYSIRTVDRDTRPSKTMTEKHTAHRFGCTDWQSSGASLNVFRLYTVSSLHLKLSLG